MALLGCGAERQFTPMAVPARRVAVIGAGLAGLHCAYRLAQAGADVTVYEANARVGGRIFTKHDLFGELKLSCELGGEFIGADHPTVLKLSDELRIDLDERRFGSDGVQAETFWFDGKEVPEATIAAQLAAVAPAIQAAWLSAKEDAAFRELDNTTLALFLDRHVPARRFPELWGLLSAAYRGEFGLDTDQQSALNLVQLLGPSDATPFRVYANGATHFRARSGNDSFALKLVESPQLKDHVKRNSRLSSIRASESGASFRMTFETQAASGFVAEAEHVVFAIPFSVLRQVDLNGVTLSEQKRKLIAELGYGNHSKLIGLFNRRVWRDLLQKSGTVTTDLAFQQVWDGSLGQVAPKGQCLLTNLLSGEAARVADRVPVDVAMDAVLAQLEGVFPGVSGEFSDGSAVRMHWPSAPLFRGSNACFRPGQWALLGVAGKREGNLHFCGEHCSADFQGWMEGAAESGALVAGAILDDLGLPWPSRLLDIVALKSVVRQPCYDGAVGAELGFLGRRAALARATAVFVEQRTRARLADQLENTAPDAG